MNDEAITIENNGMIVNMTNYYDTPQAKRGEVYLTWNAGCARLLVPTSLRHLVRDMKCDHVVVTKKKEGIHILFDDLSEMPFRMVIAHQQNDRELTEGDCLFSVYVKLGEKYQFPCKVIIEHGNTGNSSAKKESTSDSTLQIRVPKRTKAGYVKQAQRSGLNLSSWMRKLLDDGVDDDLL